MMKKKWTRTAMRFASARYVEHQEMLDVMFENGDRFLVAAESVLPGSSRGPSRRPGSRIASRIALRPSVDWTGLRISGSSDVIEVPSMDTVIEIPWDRIRSVADPDFRAHLADHAVARARRIGSRIRALRQEAGFTRAALADKVGVTQEIIAKLEVGKVEPWVDLLEQIAIALGRRLQDFAEYKKSPAPAKR